MGAGFTRRKTRGERRWLRRDENPAIASDNFAAGVLTWDVIINVRGLPTVNMAAVPINFALGANQNIWTILSAAGWAPIVTP